VEVMPFEPLNTDEQIENPVKKPRDMDAAMLFGCSGFVVTSLVGWCLSVWPFLVLPHTEKLANLGTASAVGLIPASVLGVIATRKFGLAGACGFVGSALSTGIFLYLRLDQMFLGALARQGPTPEYPRMMVYLVPCAWILASAILSLVFLPKQSDEF